MLSCPTVPRSMLALEYPHRLMCRCFEGAIAACAAPLVGVLAAKAGYRGAGTVTHERDVDLKNAKALGNAMLAFMLVPWCLTLLLYTGEHFIAGGSDNCRCCRCATVLVQPRIGREISCGEDHLLAFAEGPGSRSLRGGLSYVKVLVNDWKALQLVHPLLLRLLQGCTTHTHETGKPRWQTSWGSHTRQPPRRQIHVDQGRGSVKRNSSWAAGVGGTQLKASMLSSMKPTNRSCSGCSLMTSKVCIGAALLRGGSLGHP